MTTVAVKVNWLVENSCSGALVAPDWVLTAAHCVATLDENLNDYRVADARKFRLEVGAGTDAAQRRGVTNIELRRYRDREYDNEGRYLGIDDDVALLRLDTPVTSIAPLLLLPSDTLAVDGLQVQAFGYGHSVEPEYAPNGKRRYPGSRFGVQRSTLPGTNELWPDCWANRGDDVLCLRSVGDPPSLTQSGDSGGPWVTYVDGRPLQVTVTFGKIRSPDDDWVNIGESVFNGPTADWLRSYLMIPPATPGRIYRDADTAESWVVDDDGFRRHIPDGGTYECLVAGGAEVFNLLRDSIDLMAYRDEEAVCGRGASGDVFLYDAGTENEDIPAVTGVLESAGYTVSSGSELPDDLTAFGQIWAFSTYDPVDEVAAAELAAYVAGGGSLYVNSEHGCCGAANQGTQELLNRMLVNDITVETVCSQPCLSGNPHPFNSDALGEIASTPNAGAILYSDAIGAYTGVTGDNVLITADNAVVVGAVWEGEDLEGARGRVVAVADSNWTDLSNMTPNKNVAAVENIAAFLAG